MNKYGSKSLERLRTCHIDLQIIFEEVVKNFDNSILEGHRDEEAQNRAFSEGKSQKKWPNGKHNSFPSNAVDAIPYPVDWNDLPRIYLFAGYVLGVSQQLLNEGKISHRVRWGGDWNENFQIKDNNFNDLVHFELIF